MVGNGVTDWKYDTTPAFVEMAYWFALYDGDTYFDIKENCNLEYFAFRAEDLSEHCLELVERVLTLTTNINIYDVLGKCYHTEDLI